MIFGQTHDTMSDRALFKAAKAAYWRQVWADQACGTYWAWRPVKLQDGQWALWQTVWRTVRLTGEGTHTYYEADRPCG